MPPGYPGAQPCLRMMKNAIQAWESEDLEMLEAKYWNMYIIMIKHMLRENEFMIFEKLNAIDMPDNPKKKVGREPPILALFF